MTNIKWTKKYNNSINSTIKYQYKTCPICGYCEVDYFNPDQIGTLFELWLKAKKQGVELFPQKQSLF